MAKNMDSFGAAYKQQRSVIDWSKLEDGKSNEQRDERECNR
jgi:hypothetical protein